jgi:hypothetical protein
MNWHLHLINHNNDWSIWNISNHNDIMMNIQTLNVDVHNVNCLLSTNVGDWVWCSTQLHTRTRQWSLLSTLNWWITNGILLDNSTDSSFFLLTPLDDTPYRRMGMSYQFEESVAPALAHVVGSCSSHRTCCWFLFLPSHMLLVLASPLTVASCTLQMAGGNIGELRVKTRRTA